MVPTPQAHGILWLTLTQQARHAHVLPDPNPPPGEPGPVSPSPACAPSLPTLSSRSHPPLALEHSVS